ncbi:DUF4234 domain-containing protein [Treponema sp. OttesenSCG-928-L16]|nr:DUF4234 domain-containing protein [Treponema sp. OttesenSCG-928-L16]
MIKKRSLALYIIFSIITFGIYSLYWIYAIARDMNQLCAGDGKKTRGLAFFFFVGIITLGIYNIVWYFMLGDRLQDTAPRYGLSFKESGTAVILWMILGSFIIVGPFIALYIIIKNTNALADAFNSRMGAPTEA